MDKKIGYFLLICGLGIVLASSIMLWKIFYGTMQPPQAFEADSVITLNLASGMAVSVPLPPHINRFTNLSLSFMLMFFLVMAGGKIGGLGVKLINKPPTTPDKPGKPT